MLETVADLFLKDDVYHLLLNKYVLFIGDSVVRGMYKDLVKLLQTNAYLDDTQLKQKGEFNFENDKLLEGGQRGVMSNETTYTEVRLYQTRQHAVKFYFITRCYSDYLQSVCNDLNKSSIKPEIVIMNSGVWDLTRYGENSTIDYKANLPKGLHALISVLPNSTLFIWTTTLPLSKDIKGGFIIPELELSTNKLREDVLMANSYAARLVDELQLDVIDLHYYFMNQIQRRSKDGIHWDPSAHRRITNLLLTHICEAWNKQIPYRILQSDQQSNQPFPNKLQSKINDLHALSEATKKQSESLERNNN